MTPLSRRDVLRVGSGVLAAGLAGCSALPWTGPERWTYDAGSGRVGQPAVAGSVVFVGAEDKAVHAVDAASGDRLWRYETGGPCDRPIAAADTGNGPVAHVESDDGTLYALRDGEAVWRFETHRVGQPPLLDDGTVYLPDGSYVDGQDRGRLHAFDARTGDRRWTFRTRREHVSLSAVAGDAVVCQGRGVGPDAEGRQSRLHVLDAADGTERWATAPDEAFVAAAGPGTVATFVRRRRVSDDGRDVAADELHAFDVDSGDRRWSRTVETDGTEAIHVAGGTVYYGVEGAFVARDAETGEEQWRFDGFSGREPDSYEVVGVSGSGSDSGSDSDSGGGSRGASGGTVVLSAVDDYEDTSSVVALDAADGATRWREAVGDDSGVDRLTVGGDAVYASRFDADWTVVAVDATTGERRATYSLEDGGEWTATPGGVYVGTDDGSLVALG